MNKTVFPETLTQTHSLLTVELAGLRHIHACVMYCGRVQNCYDPVCMTSSVNVLHVRYLDDLLQNVQHSVALLDLPFF